MSGDSRADAVPIPVDVVGLGSNALDLLGVIDGHPEPDTKAPLREFEVQGGGMIATAMVACARMGLRARYVGKFGDDYWAGSAAGSSRATGSTCATRSGRAAASGTSA